MKLTPGAMCYANGATYQIDGRHSATHVAARDCTSGQMVHLAIKDLREPPRPVGTALDGLIDPLAWQRATRLAADLTPWLGHQRIPASDLAALSRRHGLSQRHIQRLRARFEADPRTTSLVGRPPGRTAGGRALDERKENVITHAIRRHYMERELRSIAHLADRIGALCRRLDLVPPALSTVAQRVKALEGYEMDRARRGAKAAKQTWESRTGGLDVSRPLQMVQIDHTRVDVLLVSEDRLRVMPRPWITLAIDVYTRCVVGWYLTMEAPSSVSVALCIEHMVLPKPENEADPGVWPMYGKPEVILADNGKDFRADALKSGCAQHGIDLRWRPVKKPHYGAHIERLNGTLMRIVHRLRGTTFSNPLQRGDYPSEQRATLTFEELKAWLVQSICREYHVKAHRALGVSPQLAWEQAWHTESGDRRPIPQVARPVDFRLDFLPREFRRIRRTGIEFSCSRYWHDDLTPFLRQREDAEIRYHPHDPSRIWVRAGRLGFIEAPAKAGRALGQSTAQRMSPQDQARMDQSFDDGLARRDAIEAAALKQTRVARQGKKVSAKVDRRHAMPASSPPSSPAMATPAIASVAAAPAVTSAPSPVPSPEAAPPPVAPIARPVRPPSIAFEIWS